MNEQGNPIKRLLLWLSGAPAETLPAAPSPAEPPQPLPQALTPSEPPETLSEPSSPVASSASTEMPPMPNDPVNDAASYGVRVVPADAPQGASYWRATRVHHLTPAENQGRHHIFLDALDEAGSRMFGAQARVTWPDGAQTITVEKPVGEPGANFPLWKWQIAAVEMLDLPSDRVENLHTGHPDEPPGLDNTLFHHSFEVVYQRAVGGAVQPPPPPPPPDGKLMERYVLFGAPASSRTAVYLELARDYLLAQQPTIGASADEAIYARQVIIVGETQDVSQETEDRLRQAGCQVQRVQGSPGEIDAALAVLFAA